MKRLQVIINRRAGTVLTLGELQAERAVRAGLAQASLDYRITFVAPQDLAAAVCEARDVGFDVVAVGGGDGTLRTAAELLLGSEMTLAILPLGTLNLLSKDLRIPQDLEEAARTIAEGIIQDRRQPVDVGTLQGEIFLVKAMISKVNATVRARERVRSRFNPWSWLKILWRAGRRLLQSRRRRYRIAFEPEGDSAETRTVHTTMLTVAVNRITGALDNPFARPDLAGGKLAVYRFPELFGAPDSDPPNTLGPGNSLTDGYLIGQAGVIEITTRRPRVYASLDGELLLLRTPLRFQVRPKALTMIGG
ncbi:MAG: diacylglycerol kinase family protein [Pseudomonadota bacterium]